MYVARLNIAPEVAVLVHWNEWKYDSVIPRDCELVLATGTSNSSYINQHQRMKAAGFIKADKHFTNPRTQSIISFWAAKPEDLSFLKGNFSVMGETNVDNHAFPSQCGLVYTRNPRLSVDTYAPRIGFIGIQNKEKNNFSQAYWESLGWTLVHETSKSLIFYKHLSKEAL
jgi:hypothetical protein